jgi:hypothetical protein
MIASGSHMIKGSACGLALFEHCRKGSLPAGEYLATVCLNCELSENPSKGMSFSVNRMPKACNTNHGRIDQLEQFLSPINSVIATG